MDDPRVATLVIHGRPPSANKQRGKNSRWATVEETADWRQRGQVAMLQQITAGFVPSKVARIRAEVRQLAKDGRHHQDIGGCFPAWKAVEDGIVDAGIIPDDTAEHVTQVSFFPCKIVGYDGMQIDVHWTPLEPTAKEQL